MGSLTHL
ncbi:hypothetical protein AB3S75_039160 [Citrus x aurantiifolia]